MLSSVTLPPLLPEVFAARVRQALERSSGQSLIQRLWDKDAGLWSTEVAEQSRIRQRLGWLSIVPVMEARAASIEAAAQDIRQAGFTHALLLGMGGSSLFAEVCRSTFGTSPGWLDLAVLDSTDPSAIIAAQARAPLERTLFIVSSKSGTTIEASALCDYFYERVRALRGDRAGQQFLAITDAGTPLEALAKERKFRQVFVHGPATGQDVGGRFSAMTCFGLVPAALMGIDIRRLLSRAKAMLDACGPARPLADNPGAQLAACLSEAAALGKDKVLFASAAPLSRFGLWAEQLVAESTGKHGKGLIPIDGEALRNPTTSSTDRLLVELQLAPELDATLERQVLVFANAGAPIVQLRWQDRYDLGGETIRWFVATALIAQMMDINPFDEPNVQEGKDRTKALLERYAREGKLPADEPILTDGGVSVYGKPRALAGASVKAALADWLQQTRAGEYLAVLSFLPRTPTLDQAVESLRTRVSELSGAATMLGYGPRYLHSTGQLHKGGPERVGLIFLTADDPVDLPVPGKPYTFSVLKQAQGLGDFEALKERNRRVLRVHLGASPETMMPRLLSMLGELRPASAGRPSP